MRRRIGLGRSKILRQCAYQHFIGNPTKNQMIQQGLKGIIKETIKYPVINNTRAYNQRALEKYMIVITSKSLEDSYYTALYQDGGKIVEIPLAHCASGDVQFLAHYSSKEAYTVQRFDKDVRYDLCFFSELLEIKFMHHMQPIFEQELKKKLQNNLEH